MKHLKSIRRKVGGVKRLVRSRRRKVLAGTLAILLLATSLRLLFLNPKQVRAATVELSTTSNTVQIDVANRYRAIMNTEDTDDYILISDRAEDDTSPDNVVKFFGSSIKDEATWRTLRWDDSRITTILESNNTRVRIRVEGCFDTIGGGACIKDVAGGDDDVIEVVEEYTFTAEGVFVSTRVDFKDGLELASTNDDKAPSFSVAFNDINNNNIIAYSEEVRYGNGETESYQSTSGGMNGDDDSYYVLQATGGYQDVIFGTMNLNGDKVLSNSSNGTDYLAVDDVDEAEAIDLYDTYTQTPRGEGQAQFFLQLHAQNALNTETEREAMFNDLVNPDYLSHTTGDLWDNKPSGDFIFSSGFEGADSNLCDGGDGWTSGTCDTGNTVVGNEISTTYDGEYAAKINLVGTNDTAKFRKVLSASYPILYVRMYFRLAQEAMDDGEAVSIVNIQDTVAYQHRYVEIHQDSGNLELGMKETGPGLTTWAGSDGYIQLNTWYSLELKVYRHDTSGTMDLWLDGNNILSMTSKDTGDNDLDLVRIGLDWTSGLGSYEMYVDNVVVSESYIGTAHHNEAEGAYTADMSVSDAEVDIDAGPNVSTLINDASVEAGDTTITVDSTTGFPSSGVAYIEGDKFSYTGTTGTTFTGIPGSGELSIIGHADNSVVALSQRHTPLYKFKNYRKDDAPQSITLEKDTLTLGTEYNASVKPFTTSYFAQDLTWHSTLESSGAVTSPDVGSGGTIYGTTTFTTGKYGNGALFDADEERISIPTTGGDSANFNKDKGTIEFWYKPNNNHTDNTQHDFAMRWVDSSNTFQLNKNSSNQLTLIFHDNGTWRSTYVTSSNYSWKAGEWVHLRFTWDKDASAGETMRIFINGTEPTHTTDSDYTGSYTGDAVLTISVYNAGRHSDGVIDEFRIYNTALTPDPIAKGGNTADSDEYLADVSDDYTFDFNNDDASNRGEYVWLGTDAPFGGVNMDLVTDGVGSSEDFDWEYWDGDSWAALTVTEQDSGSASFTADGNFYFTPPADWFPYSVNGSTDLYYIRGHLEDGSYSTDPIENRIQTDILLIHYQDNIVDENQTLHIPGITAGPNPPIAYWNFDEGYGTTANDSSGHANTGTISGATWQGEDLCYSGKCLYFDGSDDEVTRTDDPQFDSDEGGSFSISAWIRHPDISTNPDVIAVKFESTGGDGGYRLQMESDGDISFGIDTDNSSFPEDTVTSTSADFDDNRWHHVTAVKDADDNLYLYIDGNLIDTDASISATDSLDNNDDFYLGIDGDGTSNAWSGFIDEFKFYRYARSADEIKTDFAAKGSEKGTAAVLGVRDYSYLSEGLVGYWKMDESAANTCTGSVNDSCDSSGNGNDGAWTGNATNAAGIFGNGVTHDGTGDYVLVSNDNSLNLTNSGEGTLSAWVYLDSTPDTLDRFVSHGSANEFWIGIAESGTNLIARLYDGANIDADSGIAAPTGTWTHVVGTFDSSAVKVYVNGEYKDSTSAGNISYSNYQTTIGAYSGGGGGYLTGDIDDVRIYNRALTPAEVADLYEWAPGPVGYWNFDEGTGTSISDKSGNGNDVTNTIGNPQWTTGKYGSAMSFDGSDDYVTVPASSDLNFEGYSAFSFSVWVKPILTGGGTYPRVFRSERWVSDSDNGGYMLQIANNGTADFHIKNNNGGTNASTTVTANQWVHLTGTYDGSNMRIYKNGVLATTTPQTIGVGTHPSSNFQIGGSNVINATIDDLRIYNYARTTSQIIEDMIGSHPVGGSPLPSQVGYWAFDEGYGDTANDTSVNGNDGDLAGSCPGTATCPTWTNSGKFDKALDFDGGDHIVVTRDVSLEPDDISTFAWVKLNSSLSTQTNTYPAILSKRSNPFGYAMYFYKTDQELQISLGDGSSTYVSETVVSQYDWTEWHHVGFTHDGISLKVYIDGLLVDTISRNFTVSHATSTDFWIGEVVNATGNQIDGILDEVKVYNFALTANQVKLDYNQGKAVVWGATSTSSSGSPSFSSERSYCPPGDSGTCNPPVGEWNFDEKTGTTANDTSGNNNSGSITNGTWKHAGECKIGACLSFDGSSGRVLVSDSSSLDVTGIITIEAWIYPLGWGGSGYGRILVKSPNDVTAPYEFMISDTNDRLGFFTAGSWHYSDDNSISLNEWQRVAVTFDESTDEILFYVNGAEAGSDTETGVINTNSLDVAIGNLESGGRTFDGKIDDVRVYDYARTQAQIAWDYNRGGPVGYWQLDECESTTAYDASGNSNNGTIIIGGSGSNTSAGTCGGSSGEAWYHGATGKRNASLDFDGTDDYVSVTDPGTGSILDMPSSFSISLWSNWDDTSGEQFLITKGDATDNNYWIAKGGDSYPSGVECGFYNGATAYTTGLNITFSTGQWYHFTCTFDDDANAMKFYIDGVQRSSTTITNSPSDTVNNGDLRIGRERSTYGYYMKGRLDDVKVFNYPLTLHQTRNIYNEGTVRFGPAEGSP